MFSRSARFLMTLTVALAFAFATVPRGWLHHCDQEHVDHRHPHHAVFYADLDCEMCEVVVAVFDGIVVAPGLPTALSLTSVFAPAATLAPLHWPHEARGRGPPLV
jgi:hypothetical protein